MENIDMSSVQLITDSYQNYHRSVYLYILYKIGKDEDAKDLAQDVFLRLMDYKQMLRPETIKYFIFSICRNLVIDYLRRHYKMQEITSYFLDQLPTFINEVESQIIANDLSVCEQKRVLRLPAQRRKIYVMSRFKHISSADISASLGLSVRTVENHLFISRKEIREYIQQCI
jgi:RNA polymerase sigma-70 factor (family 1)